MPVELPAGLEVSQLLMLSLFQVPVLNHVLYFNLSLNLKKKNNKRHKKTKQKSPFCAS